MFRTPCENEVGTPLKMIGGGSKLKGVLDDGAVSGIGETLTRRPVALQQPTRCGFRGLRRERSSEPCCPSLWPSL